MKKNNPMFAISPLDGRYKDKVSELSMIFSEFGLMKNRLLIEVKFFIALAHAGILPRKLTVKEIAYLDSLILNFSEVDFEKIKSFIPKRWV